MLVLITGITGTLGQRLAKVALSKGLSVRGLGRNPANLPSSILENLESFIQSTSYDDIPALNRAVTGVDAIINAYAPTPLLDLDGHLLLLRAAERAGVKIFIASSWSRDWTNIRFGDFEHYDSHIAFEAHVSKTSVIKPVYVITGVFADLLFTPYGPGGFDGKRLRYWGEGDESRHPWSAPEDAAAWTIDILLYGNGVQEGKGGFFKIRSGVTSIRELAIVHEKVHGTKIDVVYEGGVSDLEAELARQRKDKGRARNAEYMSEAAAVIASKGQWEMKVVTVLNQFKEAASLEDWLRREQQEGLES